MPAPLVSLPPLQPLRSLWQMRLHPPCCPAPFEKNIQLPQMPLDSHIMVPHIQNMVLDLQVPQAPITLPSLAPDGRRRLSCQAL